MDGHDGFRWELPARDVPERFVGRNPSDQVMTGHWAIPASTQLGDWALMQSQPTPTKNDAAIKDAHSERALPCGCVFATFPGERTSCIQVCWQDVGLMRENGCPLNSKFFEVCCSE